MSSGATYADGDVDLDQRHIAAVTRGLNINNDGPIGQSFTRALSKLNGALNDG